MKKIIFYLGITVFGVGVAACGSKKETKNAEEYVTNESKAETPVTGDAIAVGESLVKANDCKTCHHKVNKIIGPAHTDVAKKYEFTKANVEMLAQKIMSVGDAEKMARYVLSLDGEKEH